MINLRNWKRQEQRKYNLAQENKGKISNAILHANWMYANKGQKYTNGKKYIYDKGGKNKSIKYLKIIGMIN